MESRKFFEILTNFIGFAILFVICIFLLALADAWASSLEISPFFKNAEIVLLAAILGGFLSAVYLKIFQNTTEIVEKKDINNDKVRAFIILFFFSTGFLLGLFVGYTLLYPQKSDMQKIDESYHAIYHNFIRNAGKERIENIVNLTSPYGKNSTRLIKIASAITEEFTDPNWAYQMNDEFFCNYPNWDQPYTYCLIGSDDKIQTLKNQSLKNITFVSDKKGHIRQGFGTDLSTDPYWIAFQKTGECQELSVLFNAVAHESGFETRIVGANGTAHIWNEVQIEGSWKFFDVQRYGEVKGQGDPSQWFGERSEYSKNTGFDLEKITLWGVCVHDYQKNIDIEDVTIYYDPDLTFPHGKCKVSSVEGKVDKISAYNTSEVTILSPTPIMHIPSVSNQITALSKI